MAYKVETGNKKIDVCLQFAQVASLMSKAIDRRCRIHGATLESVELLIVAAGIGPASAYALSKALGREHHSVIEMSGRMVSKGWIEKTNDGIVVTREGRRVVGQVMSSGAFTYVVDRLGDDDLDIVGKAVGALRIECLNSMGMIDEGPLEVPLGVDAGGAGEERKALVRKSKGKLVKRGKGHE
jgi:hypothetical protein